MIVLKAIESGFIHVACPNLNFEFDIEIEKV